MNSKILFEIRQGAKLIKTCTFKLKQEVLVGRSPNSDILLTGSDISRKHATLTFTKDGLITSDFSLNGFVLNGKPIVGGQIVPYGQQLELGAYILMAQIEGNQEPMLDIGRLRKTALLKLVENINLASLDKNDDELRPRVEAALDRIIFEKGLIEENNRRVLVGQLTNEALGLGPLEELLEDDTVSEIMVINPTTVFVERQGKLEKTNLEFSSKESVRTIIERIIAPLGRRIDESSPMVDARLKDGSRVNAIIAPLAIRGPSITIRKFAKNPFTIDDLINFGTMDKTTADFLKAAVRSRQNIVISGGTGSGKTTLLNVLAGAIGTKERIITIEDAAELSLPQDHVITLETRPANAEGKGEVTIRDLVKNALRMRPDRIVVGECRGGEALDMLQAMNTGHSGSLTTTHANSPKEALSRLETLCLMSGVDLPSKAIREQIAGAIDLVIQQSRFPDGSRKISHITEIGKLQENGDIALHDIFKNIGIKNAKSKIVSTFQATGWIPSFELSNALANRS